MSPLGDLVDARLTWLRAQWGTAYAVWLEDGLWHAQHLAAAADQVLSALDSVKLEHAIADDYAARTDD